MRAGSQTVGFHARTLEVARLAPEVWQALIKSAPTPIDSTANPALTADEAEALTELKTWSQAELETTSDGFVESAIRSLTINVSQVCNLACTYCAAGGDGTYGSKVKTPELDKVREQLAMLLAKVPAGDLFVITFLGGEPLLHPEILRAIVRDAKMLVAGREIQLRFDIVTNGTLVTAEIAEFLASIRANVTVSIDGAPEASDLARVTKSGRGSSAMVLKGLGELLRVRERLGSLNAGGVFGKHNLQLIDGWRFLSDFPFDSIKFDFAAEPGDEDASQEFARQMSEIAALAMAKGGERELRRLNVFNHLFRTLDDRVRIHNHCLAGKSHLQLDTEGRFTSCQWFIGQKDEELGRDLAIDADKLSAFSPQLLEKHGCGGCWARHLCGGGCMAINKVKTGNKHKIDNAFCNRTRTILAKGIETYAEARYN